MTARTIATFAPPQASNGGVTIIGSAQLRDSTHIDRQARQHRSMGFKVVGR